MRKGMVVISNWMKKNEMLKLVASRYSCFLFVLIEM